MNISTKSVSVGAVRLNNKHIAKVKFNTKTIDSNNYEEIDYNALSSSINVAEEIDYNVPSSSINVDEEIQQLETIRDILVERRDILMPRYNSWLDCWKNTCKLAEPLEEYNLRKNLEKSIMSQVPINNDIPSQGMPDQFNKNQDIILSDQPLNNGTINDFLFEEKNYTPEGIKRSGMQMKVDMDPHKEFYQLVWQNYLLINDDSLINRAKEIEPECSPEDYFLVWASSMSDENIHNFLAESGNPNNLYVYFQTVDYIQQKQDLLVEKRYLDNEISSLNVNIRQLDELIKEYPYIKIMQSEDFKKYSENFDDSNINKYLTGILNTPPYILDQFDYRYLSDQEKILYHYLLETEGKDSVDLFMEAYQDKINQTHAYQLANDFINSLDLDSEGNVKKSVANFLGVSMEGLDAGLNTFIEGIENAIINNDEFTVDDYKKMIVLQYLQEHSDYEFLYSFNSALGNMLPAIVASIVVSVVATPGAGAAVGATTTTSATIGASSVLGSAVGSSLIGISAFGNAKHQALVGGHGILSSTLYGLLVGTSEATLGYFLGQIPGISRTSGFTLRSLLMEGVEEFSQEWIAAGLQTVILGEDVDWSCIPEQSVESFIIGVMMSGFLNGGQAISHITINGINIRINIEKTLAYINEHPNTDIKEAFETVNNIKISEDSSISVIDPKNKIEKISDTQYQHVVDVISKNNIIELESRILSKIKINMTQLEVLRLLYIELGSKVKYSDNYQIANRTNNDEIKENLYGKDMKLDDLLHDNNIICANWTQLYSQLLLDAGFSANQIISVSNVDGTGTPVLGSHSGMFVKLDDGSFLMADLTAPIGAMTDIYNIKAGNDLTGFILFTPEQVREIASYYGQSQNIGNAKKIRSEVSNYDLETLIKGINENFMLNTELVYNDANGTKANNLTPEETKFLEIVNKFLYASEVSNNKRQSCQILERAFFSMFHTQNNGVMLEIDSKLSESRKSAQELKANIKDLKIMADAYKKVDLDFLKNDDLSEAFLGISDLNEALLNDELHDLNISVLKNYIQQRAMTEGLFYNELNPQDYSIKVKADFPASPPRVVVTVMNVKTETSKYAFTIVNNKVEIEKID